MSFLDAKPSDSKESLLNDIMVAAANQSHNAGLPLRPFAALVVKVADETAETVADLKAHITTLNEQNAKLQWWVVSLAIAALIGTVVQTTAAIYALTATPPPAAAVASPAHSAQATQIVPQQSLSHSRESSRPALATSAAAPTSAASSSSRPGAPTTTVKQ